MTISEKGIDLIISFEGMVLSAYQDSVGIWTLGAGTTILPSGLKVKQGDTCTIEQAKSYLTHHIEHRCYHALIGLNLNQNQFDALCSLVYNIGAGAFESSTVKKLANIDPNDPKISQAIQMWNKAGGKVLAGLTKRRLAESQLYFEAIV